MQHAERKATRGQHLDSNRKSGPTPGSTRPSAGLDGGVELPVIPAGRSRPRASSGMRGPAEVHRLCYEAFPSHISPQAYVRAQYYDSQQFAAVLTAIEVHIVIRAGFQAQRTLGDIAGQVAKLVPKSEAQARRHCGVFFDGTMYLNDDAYDRDGDGDASEAAYDIEIHECLHGFQSPSCPFDNQLSEAAVQLLTRDVLESHGLVELNSGRATETDVLATAITALGARDSLITAHFSGDDSALRAAFENGRGRSSYDLWREFFFRATDFGQTHFFQVCDLIASNASWARYTMELADQTTGTRASMPLGDRVPDPRVTARMADSASKRAIAQGSGFRVG